MGADPVRSQDLEGSCDQGTLLILPEGEGTTWTRNHDSCTLVRTLQLYYRVPPSDSELSCT